MRRARTIFGLLAMASLVLPILTAPVTALAAGGAGYTTTDAAQDGDGHCANGPASGDPVNCNIYDGKQFVWMNGGPVAASMGEGTYFFAVLEPSGQADPNDATPVSTSDANLSDDYDAYTNRTFSVSAFGDITVYGGTHDRDGAKIRLFPYADTGNPGGVYIMAICSLGPDGESYPVDPSDCKYDAFKVHETPPPCEVNCTAGAPLGIVKDATASFTRTFTWEITKDVDKTLVKQVGGSATFNYTVSVSHDDGTDSGWAVSGTITVDNPNDFAVDGVVVTDEVVAEPTATCEVTDATGGSGTIEALSSLDFAYACTYSAAPAGTLQANEASVSWDTSGPEDDLPAGSADYVVAFTWGDPELVDECVDVTDTFDGTLHSFGTICVGDDNPTVFEYSHTVSVPKFDCASYDNTAEFTTNDTATIGSDSERVTVCGPASTGGLTMGFWQNKNGQAIIGSYSGTSCQGLRNWLNEYSPYEDLTATNCSGVKSYVTNVIKAANAAGASMNKMLKAQMLATALDVYFSDPALGGNRIGADDPIGGIDIDLTQVCKNISACTIYENVSSAFGGATHLTVSDMLSYAASQSNPGGSVWYGQVKSMQELAKDAFDAINNQVAFAWI